MANSTFSGPVRSEGGFEQISINSSTGAVTTNLDIDSSGNIDAGSGNIASTGVLTMRQKIDNSTLNTGSDVTTVVGGSTTVTFVLPGSDVSDFMGALQLMGGTAANPASDDDGDTLTLPNSVVANARVKLTCITDDGTNSKWKAETVSTPIATIA